MRNKHIGVVDKYTPEVRSAMMGAVKSRDTKPELVLRRALHKAGLRYSLKKKFKEIRSKPDIVLVSRKVCIFVDGCFWHKCPQCFRPSKSNIEYWEPKIEKNEQRDKVKTQLLREMGWKVIRVWEHELLQKPDATVKNVIRKITK